MDIIIPVKSGSKNNNLELIYALRSLEKNLNGIGQVFICGEKISALRGLNYIHVRDDNQRKWKERNIYRKILAACNDQRVSETFLVTNDDIFITQEFNIPDMPYYHKGELSNTMIKNTGDYRKSLNHTKKFLEAQGKPTLDFDTHFPILYNKQKFITTFTHKDVNWEQPFGYVIKSLYTNSQDIAGEYGGDCKIQMKMTYEEIKQKVGDKPFLSTADGVINEGMIKYLNELYQQPSKYER